MKATTKKTTTKKTTTKKAPTKKVTVKKEVAINPNLPKVGQKAPAFSLLNQDGKKVSLKDFKGKNVVVYFYPRALTPGCTVQACSLSDVKKELAKLDIVVLGISADPVAKLKQFEEKKNLNLDLLSDEDHSVCEAYGSWGLKKFMGREFMGILRQSFFIGRDGKILHVMTKVNTKSHHDEVINFFKNLE
ncbi:MAG: thioredoxin-dependent thiol peroxidase [Candidatus Caldatribacteriota bacterium]